ncbi:hypothetical protein AB1Y20_015822 [Prymnesium parvum]|uniref:Uncharacterized protein n=1 Tax=Prymnesium parvum TaxID=97485 RepID=A0AB34K2J9_PRYPA
MATRRAVPCRAERSTHRAHVLVLAVLLPSVCVDAACFDWCGNGACGGGACCPWDDCCDCSECSETACPPRPVPALADMLSDRDLATIRSHFHGVGPLSIAVVGSSGNVLHRGAGPEIDRARIVIRFNDADAAGYESDIGHGKPQRTTGLVRVCWAGGLAAAVRRNVISDGELIIMVPDPEEHEDGSRARHPSVVVKHEWVDALHASLLSGEGLSPSTGFIGLCLALAIAQDMQGSVHAYGFGACPRCGKYDACVIPTPPNGGSPDEASNSWTSIAEAAAPNQTGL